MALDPIINPNQTDAKSPVDQLLMDGIRENLENLDTRLILSAGADFSYRVNGNLNILNLGSNPDGGKELDAAFIAQERSFSTASVYLDQQGDGGTLEIDIRRLKYLSRPISGIKNIFTANTDSVARGSAQLDTQSVTKSDGDLATQSVTYAKPTVSIDNIIQVTGSSLFRINLGGGGVLDEDYKVGDFVVVSGATDGNNNGVFDIKEVNQDNGKNIVVENALGSAQTSASGSIQLILVAYTFLSSTPDNFAIGENAFFTGHTDGSNDGTFTIYDTNVSGNNIFIKKSTALVEQVGAGGQVEVLRFSYNFLSAVNDAFVIGEDAFFAEHKQSRNIASISNVSGNDWSYDLTNSSDLVNASIVGTSVTVSGCDDPNNDGTFTIIAVNNGGVASIVVTNSLGVAQAGANGTTTFLSQNNGSLEIKDKNYNAGNNIIVYNPNGVLQPSVDGTVDTNRWVYALDSDPDGFFIVGDNAIMAGHDNVNNDGTFNVVDVKYLATNNIVIYNPNGVDQLTAGGTVDHAQKAITFREDYSADFIQDVSSVLIANTPDGNNDGTFLVLDVNRTAVSPYNIICELDSGFLQVGDAGRVESEVRSIFTAGSAVIEITQDKQVETFSIIDNEITTEPVENDTIMLLDILQAPANSVNLSVNIK